MSLPDGVTTCLVTYGPITDTFGNPADSITVEVVADRTIVHAASGRTLFKNPVSVTADSGGIAQIPVPHTNQSGFRDQQQNALTGWYYIVRLTARFGTAIQTDSKTFQPLVGQTTVDADLLSSSGMVTPGVTTPTAEVTSVAGRTGAVSASQLADDLTPFLGVPTTGWFPFSLDGPTTVAIDLNRVGDDVLIRVNPDFISDDLAGKTWPTLPAGFEGSGTSQSSGDLLTDDLRFVGRIVVNGSIIDLRTDTGAEVKDLASPVFAAGQGRYRTAATFPTEIPDPI